MHHRYRIAVATFGQLALLAGVAWSESKPVPAGPREIKVVEYLAYPPLFAEKAATLDPEDVARISWNGWMKKRGIPWGTLPGGQPTIRLSFDCRALPWPSIKQHSVDGPDNNMRSLAAHASLHDMFPQEKKNDPVEAGQVGYLLSCTDPLIGLPYSPDSMQRQCAVGHGELVKNLILMRKYGGGDWYQEWAEKALHTLRDCAVVEQRPQHGSVAFYPAGMFAPGQPLAPSPDTTLGGWQHLAVGWNCWAFAQWHELTGDEQALDFAVALAKRLTVGGNPDGNDGSFRPDGSFGGKSKDSVASCHMHGHTHCLPGLALLGSELIKSGRREEGLQFLNQASRSFDWLYDPEKNPDAGSWTGWLGEWLVVAPETERQADCEGCTMGDVVEAAIGLAATSRLGDELRRNVKYYDRAEEIFRGQCIEQMFTLREEYRAVLKHCLQEKLQKERAGQDTQSTASDAVPAANGGAEADAAELERRYQEALQTAEKLVGQQLGICGFPDWVNKLPSDLDPELPGIHMQGCCADATVRAAHAIWTETVTGDAGEARVNLAFNRRSNLLDVVSCLPHRGELNIVVKDAKRVLVRIPEWAPKEKVELFVDRNSTSVEWQDTYVIFPQVQTGQQLTVTYPLRIAQIKETPGSLDGTTYTEKWRGNTIVDISPRGKFIPMYQRPELDTDDLPH